MTHRSAFKGGPKRLEPVSVSSFRAPPKERLSLRVDPGDIRTVERLARKMRERPGTIASQIFHEAIQRYEEEPTVTESLENLRNVNTLMHKEVHQLIEARRRLERAQLRILAAHYFVRFAREMPEHEAKVRASREANTFFKKSSASAKPKADQSSAPTQRKPPPAPKR